jgi:hypothetical protein
MPWEQPDGTASAPARLFPWHSGYLFGGVCVVDSGDGPAPVRLR